MSGPTAAGPVPRRRRRGPVIVLVTAVVLVLLAVGVLASFLLARPGEDVLDARAVEQGVTGVVTTDWRRTITDPRCPDDQPVRPGTTFTCVATVDGRPQQVPVEVVDEAGTYEVGQPR